LRVLVSAYACEPGRGSEPGIGWNWACQIARFNEVWIVTRSNNRQPIEEALTREPLPNAHFVYFDLPSWARFWKRGAFGARPYYYLWQVGVYFLIKRLHRHVRFDLMHHVTFGNYWMPSFLAMLPVTFVLGPVGGGESAPRAFWWSFSMRGKIYEILRDLGRSLGQLDPFVRLAARRATVVLATTDQTAQKLKRLGCRSVSVVSQVAESADEILQFPDSPSYQQNRFRVVSVGRLLHWKGFELAVRAFARIRARFPASEYWLIGDGPEKDRLKALCRKLGLDGSVRFWGSIPRTEVLEKMAACDVLMNPSLHDSGSYVCVEAMALGLPVICLDIGGPALLVTEETGIKVLATSPEQVVEDLATAMSQLASDPLVRERLGTSGWRRVRESLMWDKKGDLMYEMYRVALLARGLQC
jgi:glycosyltransferase involved in cell wall biosynthesis